MPRRNSRDRRRPGAYHVYNRGRERGLIFKDDADRAEFISLTARFAREFSTSVHVLGFCLMGTHFHLILWQRRAGAMAPFMNGLVSAYTKYHHARHETSGRMYEGPYRARRLNNHRAFKWLIGYVHGNHRQGPDYRFSSHRAFIDPETCPPWLNVEPALRIFGGVQRYSDYMRAFGR